MSNFQIQFLDHVAIRVADMQVAQKWYVDMLGLTPYQLPEWGPIPIFLLAGKTGVALFPANPDAPLPNPTLKGIKIDHFAFQVDQDNFAKAIKKFDQLGVAYDLQDHHYFHSLYLKDPDGHTVELTTLAVREDEFYGSLNS